MYVLLLRKAKHIGQEVFPYPDMMKSEVKIYKSEVKIYKGYLRDTFLDAVQPILHTFRLLQGAYASNVIKLDGGFKVRSVI